MSDKSNESRQQEPCACSEESSACRMSPGQSKARRVAFIIVVGAAAAVAAHSLIAKNRGAPVDSEAIQANAVMEDAGAPSSACVPRLASVADIQQMVRGKSAVFVLLPGDGSTAAESVLRTVETVADKLAEQGHEVATVIVPPDAKGYDEMVKKFPSKSFPSVMVFGPTCGVIVQDDITEDKLLQSYVRATIPASGCRPGACGSSGCE